MSRSRAAALAACFFVSFGVVPLGGAAAQAAGHAADGPANRAVASDDVVTHRLDTSGVHAYWTPERIAQMPVGEVEDPGAPPVDGPTGSSVPTGTEVDGTVGRLFFVDHGEDSSCTATLVRSANDATAVTAGHCVLNRDLLGEDRQWAQKVLFVPGFRDGEMPQGAYAVRAVVVDRAWSSWVGEDQPDGYDQAFVVLERSAPGAQAIGFDVPGGQVVTELGYPRSARLPGHQGRPEFTGQRVAACRGMAVEYRGSVELPVDPGQWGVPCDMGGGASGGPRLASFDPEVGRGTVVGVNTQGGEIDGVRHLSGAQFTEGITRPLYDVAGAL